MSNRSSLSKSRPFSSLRGGGAVQPKALAKTRQGVEQRKLAAPSGRGELSEYVPEFTDLRARLGLATDALEASSVTIPSALFKLLISDIVSRQAFDEDAYLAANPDVAEAVKRGAIISAREHYISHGYFEGRLPGSPKIDEVWYLSKYPDVAAAVRKGTIKDGGTHYGSAGLREGRVGSAKAQVAKSAWDAVLGTR